MAKYVFLLLLFTAVLAAEAKYTQEHEVKFVPFIAGILIRDKLHCTGAIVDEISIVTTATCCMAAQNATRSVHIKVGSTDYQHGTIYIPDKYRIFPDYNPDAKGYDVCVIEVTKTIQFTDEVQKIDLALYDNFNNLEPGLLYKWGPDSNDKSSILKQFRLDFMDRTKCEEANSDPILDDMLCVGRTKDEKDICSIEPGAPFVIGGYLVGIKSWDLDCEHPIVFTDIFFYKDFIIE